MNKILIVLVLTLGVFFVGTIGLTLTVSANTTNIYTDQEHAKYDEVLSSDTPTIYYYYQDTCHFCNSVKDQITSFTAILNETAGIDFKLVDMKDDYNTVAWYDWDTHNKVYKSNDPKDNPDYIYEPEKMKTVDDIKITGTPTMIYVKDGTVIDYKLGEEIFDILEEVNEEFNIGYEFNRSRYGQN